ncbi:unnamed protein product [Lasius platythorax]|uniref:Ubiquitin conjugation factor E4 A n=1 Tax=Lasius platythorax TaxID=488582 RepID=A0AAV2P7N2_9HYME
MCDNIKGNPFAGLFSTDNDAVSFSSQHQTTVDKSSNTNYADQLSDMIKDKSENETESIIFDGKVNQLMAHVFGLTLCRDSDSPAKKSLVFIETDSIEHAVFERLMLSDPKSKVQDADGHVVQTQVIIYLYECYHRLKHYPINSNLEETIRNACQIVLRNANTALQEPDLFQYQEVHSQFVALFMDDVTSKSELSLFVNDMIEELIATNRESDIEDIITKSFAPVLDIVHKEAAQNTLLGALFSISCLPKTAKDPYDLFDKPLRQPNTVMESTIWIAMDSLSEKLHKVFHSLLKCSTEVRHLTLQWLSNCLHMNANRGKLWNSHIEMGLLGVLCVSDGFMLNVGNVLLRLCQPFCIKFNDKNTKIPKIDPTYCSAQVKDEAESLKYGIHMKELSSETCLIPTPEGESRPIADSYGFTTECFFLTHRALDLGYRVILDKFLRTNQDLARIQRAYNDAQIGGSSEVLELITQRMETEMIKYLSLKASLLVPEMLEHLARFHAMTAFWLVQVNLHVITEEENIKNFAPKQYIPVTFPLPETVPITLRCIPEFVIENTIGFLCFLRRLSPNTFEEQGSSFLNPILTEIIVLMESQHRLYNPHLRARLAESLEALLPTADESVVPTIPNLGTFHREQLFLFHPHRQQIIPNLLHVFVSIEMTGQSVQFEQKFNYRRPMYIVMDYLWKLDEHRSYFVALAKEAENNMEAVQPPLFLRFINLLMNDAVFLLDEALSNMTQLKQMLQARENGEWNKLPPTEREQQAGYLQHIVGPNKKNLKVNDQKEYAFNPANLVLNICEIYINLSKNENFTLAVSQDGRSYSPELFKLADNVLVRIGGVGILGDLDQFAKSVEKAANQKREEDEILIGIPDEFLDPIMSTVMTDPVILPSSKITIDRQTIARHLLSDQTDPFNRSPLTMDMIKSNVELQQKIQEWISQRKQEKLSADT